MKKRNSMPGERGHTLLELVIVCIVFSLFLLGVFTVLDVGLKSWQLGETKTDLHQKAEIVINRVVKDFSYSNMMSVEIENSGDPSRINEYISFETPVNNGNFEFDSNNYGSPVWQGYILYYIKPLRKDWSGQERTFFRQYIPRIDPDVSSAPSIHPKILGDALINFKIINPVSDNLRTVVKDIYEIDFNRTGNIVKVEVQFQRHIRTNASVAFSPGAGADKGTEIVIMNFTLRSDN